MEWSSGAGVVSGESSVDVTVWVVGARLRGNSGGEFVSTSWCRCRCVPLLRGRLLPLVVLWGRLLPLVVLRGWCVPLLLGGRLLPLVPLWFRCVPVVGRGGVVEGCVVADWEVWALAWVNSGWVLGSLLC